MVVAAAVAAAAAAAAAVGAAAAAGIPKDAPEGGQQASRPAETSVTHPGFQRTCFGTRARKKPEFLPVGTHLVPGHVVGGGGRRSGESHSSKDRPTAGRV